MGARNHKNWLAEPSVEYISSECYSSQEIYEKEIKLIFAKVWIPIIHKSEIKNPGDYRTSTIAFQSIIIINLGERIGCYINPGVKGVSGNIDLALTHTSRELHCEVKHGGMVWTTLNPNPTQSVEEWTDGAFDCVTHAIYTEELEVFHYHKAIIPTNYKLWHDTNSEFYHDFMHYFNRITGFNDEYFARPCTGFDNGHVNVGSFEVQYDKFEGAGDRGALSFPGIPPNQWYMVDLFPGYNFNLRGSAYRSDSITPLGPDSVMIEFRGYGLLSDSPEDRKHRIDHHNTIWGPFGRNLHEDLLGVTGQGVAMAPGTERRNILHGRHENNTIHDEVGMRHYYAEWGRYLNVDPANPLQSELDKAT